MLPFIPLLKIHQIILHNYYIISIITYFYHIISPLGKQLFTYDRFFSVKHINFSVNFFKLALVGGASDMSRDTHCATCHELVFLKLYLAVFYILYVSISI